MTYLAKKKCRYPSRFQQNIQKRHRFFCILADYSFKMVNYASNLFDLLVLLRITFLYIFVNSTLTDNVTVILQILLFLYMHKLNDL